MVRRKLDGVTFAGGRQTSTRGSNTAHCPSVRIVLSLLPKRDSEFGRQARPGATPAPLNSNALT
jgi:hypothetical protein